MSTEILTEIIDVSEVDPKLQGVLAVGPVQGVGKLLASLVGEGWAL